MLYYVNANAQIKTGAHKIHLDKCPYYKVTAKSICLGEFFKNQAALHEASKYFACVSGCKYCCKDIYVK